MSYKTNTDADWYACPDCGAEVRVGSRGCEECRAKSRKPWEQDGDHLDGVDMPEDFDYDDFIRREFEGKERLNKRARLWKITAIVLLVLMVLGIGCAGRGGTVLSRLLGE